MGKKITIILGPEELIGLEQEYPDRVYSSELVAVTPDAYEKSFHTGLSLKVQYPKWAQAIRTFSIDSYKKVEFYLKQLEKESFNIRSQIFEGDTYRVDWNYQSNFFILNMLLSGRSFAKQAYEHLKKYELIELVTLKHAGEFYFDSCIQPVIVCHELQKLGLNAQLLVLDERFKANTHQPHMYENIPDIFSENFLRNLKKDKKSLLIATAAIYRNADQKKLIHFIEENYRKSKRLVYPLPMWPVIKKSDIFEQNCTLQKALELLSKEDRTLSIAYTEWLSSNTESTILKCLDDYSLRENTLFRMQMQRLFKRHLYQILTYLGWRKAFNNNNFEILALTIQDSGINGPISSAALLSGVKVVVFPHSHVLNWETQTKSLVVTEWWQPVESKSLWGESNQTIYYNQSERDEKIINTERTKCNKWMILYNGVQENIYNTVAWPFIQKVVEFILIQTQSSQVSLVHRLKPGDQTPLITFCELLQLDRVKVIQEGLKPSLDELFFQCELIISIDDPSSALWEALSKGCAVILVADRPLTKESLIDMDVLSPVDLTSFIELIKSFIHDPDALEIYKSNQQARYKRLFEKRMII